MHVVCAYQLAMGTRLSLQLALDSLFQPTQTLYTVVRSVLMQSPVWRSASSTCMHVRTGAADGTNRFTDVAYIAEVAALAALMHTRKASSMEQRAHFSAARPLHVYVDRHWLVGKAEC